MLRQQHEPKSHDLAFLQEWMKRPSMGGVYLFGRDRDTWEHPVPGDLITLSPDHGTDLLSSWLTAKSIQRYHRLIGRYFKVCESFFVPFTVDPRRPPEDIAKGDGSNLKRRSIRGIPSTIRRKRCSRWCRYWR